MKNNRQEQTRLCLGVVTLALLAFIGNVTSAGDKQTVTHRVTGLFSPDREDDLRLLLADKIPEVTLVSVDFESSEARFTYDADLLFNRPKPEQVVERFDNLLRSHSRGTFGIRSVCAIPKDQLKQIEIPIVGLDCKGCCLAVYETIYKIEGVEQAAVSFKDGRITARINPDRVDRAALEEALKKRGVTLGTP